MFLTCFSMCSYYLDLSLICFFPYMLLVLVPLEDGPNYLFYLLDQSVYKIVLDRAIVFNIYLTRFDHITSFRWMEA